METVTNAVKTFDTTVSATLQRIEQPMIVRALVTLFLMLYAAKIAPTPPQIILDLFENFYFRLFIFTLILWTAQLSPSTAILIALCFLVTVNYSKSGKLFESLENTDAPVVSATPEESVKAVVALAEAASSPDAIDATLVGKVADIAVANQTTNSGVAAVQALAQQAVTPVAGVPEKVEGAVQQAVESIPTPHDSVKAVAALAEAASQPTAADAALVQKVADIAVANQTTNAGVAAVQALAQQAVTPVAGVPEKVESAVQQAIESIPQSAAPVAPVVAAPVAPVVAAPVAPVETGCYPVRNYDMTKVQAMTEGQDSFEDLASFEL